MQSSATTEDESAAAQQFITQILVDEWQPLSQPVEFDLFTSSLTFVWNLRQPEGSPSVT